MQVVIEIDENLYTRLFDNGIDNYADAIDMARAIRKGTLFDLEGLKSDMKALNCGYPYGLDYLLDCLNKRLGITLSESKE